MFYRPDIQFAQPASAARATHAQRRLALGLVASALLHLLWLGLAHAPAFPRLPSRTADSARLTLTLAPTAPRTERQAVAVPPAAAHTPTGPAQPARARPSAPAPAAEPQRAAATSQRTRAASPERVAATPQPAPAADPERAAAPAETVPASRPAAAPETATQARLPSGADLLAAARQDVAAIARDLNHAPGSKTEFRSRAQEDLDRRFDAAQAAGGSWFRSARVEEITTAADGSRRVYRIVTPLGAFCRTYYGDGKQPMNTTCPR